MKIGLFGGTFDPPHFGHLRAAIEVKERFQLDEIWFIPSYQPPHKDPKKVSSFFHRKKMLELATKNIDFFLIKDCENRLPRPSYTINTVRYLKETHPYAEFFLILGLDSFMEINKWKDYDEIINHVSIIVVSRQSEDLERLINLSRDFFNRDLIHSNNPLPLQKGITNTKLTNIYYQEITRLEISSDLIRNLIKDNKNPLFLLPDTVINYINKFKLYRTERLKAHKKQIDSEVLAHEIVQIILDNKGKNIKLLDLRGGYSDIADFFIICDASSIKRIEGIADKIEEELAKFKILPSGIEGKKEGRWLLLDYGDVVVHIFDKETRLLYDLEGLWSKAKITLFEESIEQELEETEEEEEEL